MNQTNLTLTLHCSSINDIGGVAQQLLSSFPNEHFYAFFGAMGVGKTTLIKELCSQLGVHQNVCSPTFSIVNEYSSSTGDPIYHFDFYRINKAEEVYDIGYEEYFYSGYFCFTEWTEKIENLLPEHYLRIEITEHDGLRTIIAKQL